MNGVTRKITLGNANALGKNQALRVAMRILLGARVGDDPATERKEAHKALSAVGYKIASRVNLLTSDTDKISGIHVQPLSVPGDPAHGTDDLLDLPYVRRNGRVAA